MKIGGVEATGLTKDSNAVRPGWAFFAISGLHGGSINYIPMALEKGAAVIVADEGAALPVYVPPEKLFRVPNARRFLAESAVQFFQPLPENIIAVTGTSGKSSVVHFIQHMLNKMEKNAATIGTLGLNFDGRRLDMGTAGNTTPDPVLLCRTLRDLKMRGCEYAALEATSMGLDQERMNALPIKVAGFTNLTREHLSDHGGSMEQYFAAKKRLFSEVLPNDGVAVLNADDDASFESLSEISNGRIISYGRGGRDIKLIETEFSGAGQRVRVEIGGAPFEYALKAVGGFQAYNSMCAVGMLAGLGLPAADLVRAIDGAASAAGRMQYVGTPVRGGGVFVDFAHTPDQIKNVLLAARQFCKGRLMIMLGLGGGRDSGGRALCGAVMNELADVAYVTDGNWRTEDPDVIRAQIAAGCPKAVVIKGRPIAVARAIRDMRENDVLILAAKGERDVAHLGKGVYHMSDIEEARKTMDLIECFPGRDDLPFS